MIASRDEQDSGDRADGADQRPHEELTAGALFFMSARVRAQVGPVATWITAAGWASAAKRMLGRAWLVTPNGVLDPGAARELATRPARPDGRGRSYFQWIPETLKTLLKDVRDAIHAYRMRDRGLSGRWEGSDVQLVWQRHDLFFDAGLRTARQFHCPCVVFVDAPVVWEARRWGVRRPGWGGLLEAVGEARILRRADLVACVSQEVAEEVERLGVSPNRIIVTPCCVDLEVFNEDVDGSEVRIRHKLERRFVVGWTGSFRRFHGLGDLLDAFARFRKEVPAAILLLVGDGAERPRIVAQATELGVHGDVVFTGTVPHDDIPAHVAAMNVAVLTAPADAGFHYSPLKLKEYMACGRAIVAPRIGQIPSALTDGSEGLLFDAGDSPSLAGVLAKLHQDRKLRSALGAAAANRVRREGIWEHQMGKALNRLSQLSQP